MSIGHLRPVAVSCGQYPLVTDEGATTVVEANVEGHLVRQGILLTGVAPNNLVIIAINGKRN